MEKIVNAEWLDNETFLMNFSNHKTAEGSEELVVEIWTDEGNSIHAEIYSFDEGGDFIEANPTPLTADVLKMVKECAKENGIEL